MLKSAVLLQDKTTYLLVRIRSGYKPKSHLLEYPEILLTSLNFYREDFRSIVSDREAYKRFCE